MSELSPEHQLILQALLKSNGQEQIQTNKVIDQMNIPYTPGKRESTNFEYAPEYIFKPGDKPAQTMNQATQYNRWNPIDQWKWLTNK